MEIRGGLVCDNVLFIYYERALTTVQSSIVCKLWLWDDVMEIRGGLMY